MLFLLYHYPAVITLFFFSKSDHYRHIEFSFKEFSVQTWLHKHALKVSKYGVFCGPYFPAFGLNTEIYSLSLRIQSEC